MLTSLGTPRKDLRSLLQVSENRPDRWLSRARVSGRLRRRLRTLSSEWSRLRDNLWRLRGRRFHRSKGISGVKQGQLTNTTESQKGTKQDFLQKTWVVCALALVCTFLWGSASPCIKLGYALFHIPSSETWTQVLFAGTRFILAGVLTVLIGSVLNRKMLVPTKSSIPSSASRSLPAA